MQDNDQTKDLSKSTTVTTKSGSPLKLDECERSIGYQDRDEELKTKFPHPPSSYKKEPDGSSHKSIMPSQKKTVLAFASLKDLSTFKMTIKGSYLRVNITNLTITAAFSKEAIELALTYGAKIYERQPLKTG